MTKTSKITYTAIFAAIATVLMYFEFPIPSMPPFLKVDLSGAVVLIGARLSSASLRRSRRSASRTLFI